MNCVPFVIYKPEAEVTQVLTSGAKRRVANFACFCLLTFMNLLFWWLFWPIQFCIDYLYRRKQHLICKFDWINRYYLLSTTFNSYISWPGDIIVPYSPGKPILLYRQTLVISTDYHFYIFFIWFFSTHLIIYIITSDFVNTRSFVFIPNRLDLSFFYLCYQNNDDDIVMLSW